MKTKYLFLFYSLIFSSCTEEFFINDSEIEKLLVVDGFIINDSPCKILLSYSSSASEPAKIPCENSIVVIYDNKGNSETLEEIEKGVYVTSDTGIKGVIGNKYKIEIKTIEGKEYATEFQEMKNVIEIDSIFAKTENEQNNEYPYSLPGLQFYINTSFTETKDNYFLWTMTETYEYDIDNQLQYYETSYGLIIHNTIMYDTLKTCWNTENIKQIYTGETESLKTPYISNKKLHFVNSETKKLTKRYSVIVNQYIINKNAYLYWKNIEFQISNNNFLSASQPYNITGNIKNKKNINEIVLGYFTVASLYSKRIFVDRPRINFYYPECFVVTGSNAIADYKRTHAAPYFYVEVLGGEFGITSRSCIDCRAQGGDIYRPSFWINY